MLNIYTLAGKKFLKCTDSWCQSSFYIAIDSISLFKERLISTENYTYYLNIVTNDGEEYETSYKWSDLEELMKG